MRSRRKWLVMLTGVALLLLSGCAGDYYSGYDNRSYEERQLDRAAQHAEHEAVTSLSAQDIKNINSLK